MFEEVELTNTEVWFAERINKVFKEDFSLIRQKKVKSQRIKAKQPYIPNKCRKWYKDNKEYRALYSRYKYLFKQGKITIEEFNLVKRRKHNANN